MSDQDKTPAEETSRNVQDRMAQRLDDGGTDTEADDAGIDGTDDMRAQSKMSDSSQGEPTDAQRAMRDPSAWDVDNIRNAWTGVTIYLPNHLQGRLDDEYRRVDYDLEGEISEAGDVGGTDLRKDRHFKPLVIALGLERLSRMEGNDLNACIERMMRHENPEGD